MKVYHFVFSIFFIVCTLVTFLSPSSVLAKDGAIIVIPSQRLSVALSTSTWERSTESTTKPGSSSMGVGAGYQLFVGEAVALDVKFGFQLGNQSEMVLLGGGAGVAWYLLGGSAHEFDDPFISYKSLPNMNLWIAGGMGFYSFDFTLGDAELNESNNSGTNFTVQDPRDTATGSVMGIFFEAGFNFPFTESLIPGVGFNMFNSFENPAAPTISITNILLKFDYII